jgi:hypothetical protein
MTTFSNYVKCRSAILGRSEAAVRAKLNQMGVKASDSPKTRNAKITKFINKKFGR